MTVEATAVTGQDPYEGLLDLTDQIMDLLQWRIEESWAWKRLPPIMGGAPGITIDFTPFFDNLRTFLDWQGIEWTLRWRVWEPFLAWVHEHIFSPLIDHWNSFTATITAWWSWITSTITGHLTSLKDSILGWWQGFLDSLQSHLSTLTDTMTAWWNWLTESLKTHLTSLKDSILGWWYGAIDWALGHLTGLKDAITSYWYGITDWILGHLTSLKDSITSYWHGITDWILGHLTNLKDSLVESILEGLSNLWVTITTGLREWWAQVQPQIIEAAEAAIEFARPYIEKWVGDFQEVPAAFLEWVAATAGTDLALHPSTALATTGSLYSMSIATGTLAMSLATALNVIPATNWVGAQQFSAFIAEAAGFEPITRATYGVLLNEVLAWPLRYHWNEQLRPKLPTEGALLLMGRKRGLSEGEWRTAMAYQGIPDWYLDKIYLFNWTDPSPFWVSRVTEAHIPDWSPDATWQAWADQWMPGWRADSFKWVRAKLLLAGYERADVDSMIEAISAKLLASAITQVKTSVRAMLREGYWTKADAEGALRPMGVRQDEIEYLYLAEELDYQKGYLDDDVRYWQESFRKAEISDQDLSLALSTIIVKPERVAQIVAREQVRALPTPKKIVPVKEDPLVTRLVRAAVDSWIDLYREWQIDEDELRFGLTLVVQDTDLAAAMVAVEETRYRPPPVEPAPPPEDPLVAKYRRQAIASWIDAYRQGEIPAEELELGLADLVATTEVRDQLVELEKLRYQPTPEIIEPVTEEDYLAEIREETVRGHIAMLQKRLIGPDELYDYLLADGLVESLARATVITQATKRIRTPPLDSPYFQMDIWRSLIDEGIATQSDLYMEGEITVGEYIAYLESMGLDPDAATYLADTITLRKFLEGL